jgi:hypothetical protein
MIIRTTCVCAINFFQGEDDYERWQLLKEPVSLENFLVQPLLTGNFFDYSLRLEPELTHPIIVHEKKTTINIWAWEPVRYRYKFFPANRVNLFVTLIFFLSN